GRHRQRAGRLPDPGRRRRPGHRLHHPFHRPGGGPAHRAHRSRQSLAVAMTGGSDHTAPGAPAGHAPGASEGAPATEAGPTTTDAGATTTDAGPTTTAPR